MVDVEGPFSNEPNEKVNVSTSASTFSPVFSLSRYTQTIQTTLTSLGALPDFDHLQEFHLHLV